jgi:hypothetical protein
MKQAFGAGLAMRDFAILAIKAMLARAYSRLKGTYRSSKFSVGELRIFSVIRGCCQSPDARLP